MDSYMIAGIVIFGLFVLVASLVMRRPVGKGPRCPSCHGPTTWRTCPAWVSAELHTAAICGACNRIGGAR